ncbi:hypothetical protein BKA70DRAFT_1427105 [Coprinopsis sp. MPI-PUGE-AT-0042]|nr:hypothetical protein BKA70DRAFT_1427105 [Coprinopsis sp. MPI-PUGE-AT-0042]
MSSTRPPDSSQFRKHPKFWDNIQPTILVFRIDGHNDLYCLNIDQLSRHCDTFKNMASFPQPKIQEGTEENPIVLEGISRTGFEGFLSWTKHVPWRDDSGVMRTEPALQKDFIDILRIGDLFMSKTLMGWALRKLDSMDLSPSQALGIAIRFRVRIWLDKCIKGVLLMPTTHLSLEYIQEMNPHQDPFITYTIMKAREALLTERHHVATTPLFIPVDDADRTYCDSDRHKKCVQATQAVMTVYHAPIFFHFSNGHPLPSHLQPVISYLFRLSFDLAALF